MAYTVKQLAALSGVSVRTLHFYDEAGLLKPAYYGSNGYRYYEEAQVLMLQQVLFYRELGFELKEIQRILRRANFEKVAALKSHRRRLLETIARNKELVSTIDKTIAHLKGQTKMKSEEMFAGFSPEEQARHERYLVERFGEPVKGDIARSKAKVKNWSRADWERSGDVFARICKDLVSAMERKQTQGSPEVQQIVRRHYEWLQQFWKPNRESYTGYSQLVVDSELRAAYESHHPKLPEFAAEAMRVFAENELH
jgi:MerR family transcriptional regulator, thiopeptide resistance regulator